MNREDELKYLNGIIESKKILFRNYWVTATSFVSAILVGGSLAFLTGRVTDELLQDISFIFFGLLPVIIVVLAEIFFRLIEYNLMFEKILVLAKSYNENNFLEICLQLINLEVIPYYKNRPLRISALIFATKIRFFYLLTAAILSYFLVDTDIDLITGSIGILIIFLGFSYIFHKTTLKTIKRWPQKPPWVKIEDKQTRSK